MRFASVVAFCSLTPLCAPLLACSSLDAAPMGADQLPPGKGGPDASIQFEDATTLALTPGQQQQLTIVTSPPDRYEVRFVLLGDTLDAALDQTLLVADASGRASVVLDAPSKATTFRVRATIKDGPSAEIAVSVSDQGFGTLLVTPAYAGKRETPIWTASAVAHTTCAELTAILPGEAEGALYAEASSADLPVLIHNAPVGPSLAVAIRAGHYAWGCIDETHLLAGKELEVKVPVVDEPIDLTATDLALSFEYEPEPLGYGELLGSAVSLLAATFMPGQSEAAVLVDAMGLELDAADTAAFYAEAGAANYEAIVAQHLAAKNVGLAEQCAIWATPAGYGSHVLGDLLSAGDGAGQAELFVTDFAGVDAATAGVPESHLVSWTADPDDTVHLGGKLYWLPTRWLGSIASQAAKTEVPTASGLPEALATKIDCDELGASLGGYATCDVACLSSLCRKALATRWTEAVDASATTATFGSIDLAASGVAVVDDIAMPVSFEGQWVGKVSIGPLSADVTGKASGQARDPAGPPR